MKKNVFIYLFLILIWGSWSYAECTSGDCVNGKGTLIYPDGRKVVGIWKDNKLQK